MGLFDSFITYLTEGGKKEGLLIKKGKIIEKIPQDQIVARLKEEIDKF